MGEDEGRYRFADVVGVVGVWITEPLAVGSRCRVRRFRVGFW